jgi:hypothetical protein
LSASEHDYITRLESSFGQNLLIPQPEALQPLQYPVGIIAHVLRCSTPQSSRNFALIEHHGARPGRPTGIGKTTVALRLLGVDVPLDEIPRPANRHDPAEARQAISELGDRTVGLYSTNKSVQTISSDMPYLGLRDGTLQVATIIGEPILALWDLARSISRAFDAHYRAEGGRDVPWLREYVEKLADTYYLSFGERGMFCDSAQTYSLDHVFIFKKRATRPGKLSVKITNLHEERAKDALIDQLKHNPMYQCGVTPFWQIDRDEHVQRLMTTMSRVCAFPSVSQIEISADSPDSYIDDVGSVVAHTVGLDKFPP